MRHTNGHISLFTLQHERLAIIRRIDVSTPTNWEKSLVLPCHDNNNVKKKQKTQKNRFEHNTIYNCVHMQTKTENIIITNNKLFWFSIMKSIQPNFSHCSVLLLFFFLLIFHFSRLFLSFLSRCYSWKWYLCLLFVWWMFLFQTANYHKNAI